MQLWLDQASETARLGRGLVTTVNQRAFLWDIWGNMSKPVGIYYRYWTVPGLLLPFWRLNDPLAPRCLGSTLRRSLGFQIEAERLQHLSCACDEQYVYLHTIGIMAQGSRLSLIHI